MFSAIERSLRSMGRTRPSWKFPIYGHSIGVSVMMVALLTMLSTPGQAECSVEEVVDYVKAAKGPKVEKIAKRDRKLIMKECGHQVDVGACTFMKVIDLVEERLDASDGNEIDHEKIDSECTR